MKKIPVVTAIATLCVAYCAAQPGAGLLLPIPEALKKDAHSVKREESITLEIKSIDKAYYKVHQLITVLDASHRDVLNYSEYTDKFHSLEDFSIVVYNASGEKIKKYSKKDLASQSNIGEGLVSDGKVYYLEVPAPAYPMHIQIDYELKFNGVLAFPAYQVQAAGQSVEKSSFTTIVPATLDIRYKAKNVNIAPFVTTDKENKIYTWTTSNMAALRFEPESVSYESRYPSIIVAPNKFSLDGYEGDMTSWEKYGEWYGALSKKSGNLNEDRKNFYRGLVKHASSDKEKAAIIYKYLQDNCRYVLITLGIGGFKPFEASFVDTKKYGDCKALSNYTQACLDAVGIKSYQALINAAYNKEPVDPLFPYHSFNHVILCVPQEKDSIWLECTSNTNEFGVLGSFTENRNALLITEHGGKLVSTPKSISSNNLFTTSCLVNLKEDGSGNAKVILQTKGEYKTHFMLKEKKDDQKTYIVNTLGFIQPDDFTLTENKNSGADYNIDLDFEKIPSFTAGNKMFLSPRIYKIWNANLPDAANRTQDFYFSHPFIKKDSTVYRLPAGYVVDALPQTKKLRFEYGSFNSTYAYDKSKNELLIVTDLELKNHHIPSGAYKETKNFFDAVLAEYNGKLVIKKE